MYKTAILIPVYNNLEYTKKCLSNLTEILNNADTGNSFTIIIIDDGSTDGTSDWIKGNYPEVVLLKGNGNLWWSGGINLGANYAIEKVCCDYLLLWNNDIQVDLDYFRSVSALIRKYPDDTLIGSKIYADPEKTRVWSMGGYFSPITGKFGMHGYLQEEKAEYKKPVSVDWLTGMGTIVPARVVREIGYWDEKNFPQYLGDTEFSYRAKIYGFKNITEPGLKIWNDTSSTGLNHNGAYKKLKSLFRDKRSLYNFKVNIKFYQLYAKNPLAYLRFVYMYSTLLGSFIKCQLIYLFRKKRREC